MRATIDYDAARDRYIVYLVGENYAVSYSPRDMTQMNPGDEMPPFLQLRHEEYLALTDAIMSREAPRLADPALYREMLEDTRDVRDRLLTMLETP